MITHLRNGFVFKYAFLYQSFEFSPVRLTLEYLIHRSISSYTITNPELLKSNPKDKGGHYDIKLTDDFNNHYEIEMQDTKLTKTQIKRMTYYGAKLIDSNITAGENYHHIKQNIQIIFINDIHPSHPTLVECYESRNEQGEKEGESIFMTFYETVLLRYYIYLPYIQQIEKEKGIENLDDFETMISIIYHGIHPKMKKGKVVKHMEKILNTVNNNTLMSIKAYERAVYLATEQEEKNEYFENGKRVGFDDGLINGEKTTLIRLYQDKYPSHDLSWIMYCSKKQIEFLYTLFNKDISYQDFKKQVMKKKVAL